jgi:hypothetical protein
MGMIVTDCCNRQHEYRDLTRIREQGQVGESRSRGALGWQVVKMADSQVKRLEHLLARRMK